MTKKSTQRELALELGVSPRQVRRLASERGMPTSSLAAAREWREANLDPAFRRERLPGDWIAEDGETFTREQQIDWAQTCVLMALPAALVRAGLVEDRAIDAVLADLEQAFRAALADMDWTGPQIEWGTGLLKL